VWLNYCSIFRSRNVECLYNHTIVLSNPAHPLGPEDFVTKLSSILTFQSACFTAMKYSAADERVVSHYSSFSACVATIDQHYDGGWGELLTVLLRPHISCCFSFWL
jgi:hypothetical protein